MGNRRTLAQLRRGPKRKRRNNAFALWIESTGLTIGDIAARLDMSESFVANLRMGTERYRPSLTTAIAIERISAGAVPASSWGRR